MRRRQFIASAGALAFAAGAADAAALKTKMTFADPEQGRWGGAINPREFEGMQAALEPEVFEGTGLQVLNAFGPNATRVVLDNLPTVSTQGVPGHVGAPGSCEAQSFGYCLGAYTAARHPDGSRRWSAAEARNQPSPAWLYHWQHVDRGSKDCPAGSGAAQYAQQLVGFGAPSVADYPYNPSDETTVAGVCTEIDAIPITPLPSDASRLLVGSFKVMTGVKGQKSAYLDTFRALIRSGNAIAFSGLVPTGYGAESPPMTSGAYTAPQGFITGSGHGQVIVGYDNSLGPNGAFLVQNSFGPDWNPGSASDPGYNGRIWYDYDAWFAGQGYAMVMYPNSPNAAGGTRLTASASGVPKLFIKEGKRYKKGGKSYLMLIVHVDGAVYLNQLTVTGPHGMVSTAPVGEAMRYGYVYVERGPEFKPGHYDIALTGNTLPPPITTMSYTGSIDVT
jgi:hypothetical protein